MRARTPARALRHIPGADGLPFLGQTIAFLADQEGWTHKMVARHGPVFRNHVFFERSVALVSPTAVHTVLRDKGRIFSSELGWRSTLGRFFSGGLMLRDFEDHRRHRSILQEAFRKSALAGYLELMTPVIARHVEGWVRSPRLRFYRALKQLTLDLASVVFLGLPLGRELARVQRAFVDMLHAPLAIVRVPLPGLTHWRGLRARAYLRGFFHGLIRQRRAQSGADLLSRLCHAVSEDGARLTDDEIVDHLSFVMMAGHDTTTSALTNLVHLLGMHETWQERLRAGFLAVGPSPCWEEALGKLTDVDLALKETLRLYPPVVAIPRRTLSETVIDGVRIPADTTVWLEPRITHTLAEYWTQPLAFDPERFADHRAEHKRHPGLWYPYGGGAHTCLGLQLSSMQAKAILHPLLGRYRVRLPGRYAPRRQVVPFPKPVDDLPVYLEPL